MTLLRPAICAAFLLLSIMPVRAQQAAADSLLERLIGTLDYDRFLTRTFSAELALPEEMPYQMTVRQSWDRFYNVQWFLDRVRREFLADSSPEEIQEVLDWLEDPVVRRAIAHDYASADAENRSDTDEDDATLVAAMEPRRVAAARRISRAAGDGIGWVQLEADRTVMFVRFALGDEYTPQVEASVTREAARAVAAFRAEGVELMQRMVATRFASFPIDDMEHYADALETEAGQDYLRLVIDGPTRAMRSAVEIALDKATKPTQ